MSVEALLTDVRSSLPDCGVEYKTVTAAATVPAARPRKM